MKPRYLNELDSSYKVAQGVDLQWLATACVAINEGKQRIPGVLDSVLDHVKLQATSSVEVPLYDMVIYNGLLLFAAEKTSGNKTSWLNFRGQHDRIDKDGEIRPVRGNSGRSFRHNDTLFFLELAGPDYHVNGDDNNDQYHMNWGQNHPNDARSRMTIHCFGGSNDPVRKLLAHIKLQAVHSEILTVAKIMVDVPNQERECSNRPLSTIDLEPKMLHDIRQDAEDFFDESTAGFCRDTGRPCPRGYLFFGPPGTGKTSLSVAIASHVDVPLYAITPLGMDDSLLEEVFSRLPSRCVVLIEGRCDPTLRISSR